MKNLLKHTQVLGLCCVISLLFVGQIFAVKIGEAPDLDLYALAPATDLPKLQVNAYWELDDMSINSPQHAVLLGLEPLQRTKLYQNKDFEVFLPQFPTPSKRGIKPQQPPSVRVRLGDVWEMDVTGILPFLQQFHPGATVSLSGKRGAYACLQAISETHTEILFRFHADFNLSVGIVEAEAKKLELAELEAESKKLSGKLEKATAEAKALKEELGAEGKKLKLDLEKETTVAKELKEQAAEGEQLKLDLEKETAKLGEADLSEITRKLDTRFTALERKLDKQLSELRRSLTTALAKKLDERFATLEQELAKNLTTMLTKELNAQLTAFEQELAKNLTAALTKELDKQVTEMKQASDNRFSALEDTLALQEARFTEQLNALSMQVTQRNATYFTPTYFTGRLIINLKTHTVEAFSLSIPMHDENATIFTAGFGTPVKVSVPKMTLMSGAKKLMLKDPMLVDWRDAISRPFEWKEASSIPYVEAEAALHAVMRGDTPPDHMLKTK